jgi:hypothetical protein
MVRPVAAKYPVTLGYRQPMRSRPDYIHRGIDYGCPTGTEVHATRSGVVVAAGTGGGYGPAYGTQVVVRVGDIWCLYAHLSKALVRVGERVETEQAIGLSGATGNVTGPHLHYQENTQPPAAYKSDRKPQFVEWQEPTVNRYPADVFGKNWKLTVPADGPDAGTTADEVKQPALSTYTSLFCRVPDSDPTSVLFTVHHGAPTTPGSKNPRSELREMTNNGLNIAKWDGRHGKHRMAVELSVNKLTTVKPQTVVAQIHDASDDVTVLRAEGVKGTERIKLWITRGDSTHAYYIGEVKRTQRFKFAFDVSGGKVHYDFNGKRLPYTVPATAASFFKVGAYLQSNPETAPSESTAAYTQVRLFGRPEVHHE